MRVMFLALGTLVLTGCFAEVLTTTAITSELQAQQVGAMQRQLQGAADRTGKVNLQRAVDTHFAEKGAYPATLEDLVPGYLPSVPTHPDGSAYGYDPATGRVTDRVGGGGPHLSLQAIHQAINAYGTNTGYYPPTLDALYPDYLPAKPRTPSGREYFYNNQTGEVVAPGQMRNGTAGRGGGGVGGGGPMGEMMTGVGVQRQLNSMGQSGANSAGTRSRSGVQDITNQHNQQQQDALDALGF